MEVCELPCYSHRASYVRVDRGMLRDGALAEARSDPFRYFYLEGGMRGKPK